MQAPTRADYVKVYFTLFAGFQQERGKIAHGGHPFEYADQVLIVFFTMMIVRRITAFKTQQRWLRQHVPEAIALGFEQIPHRITLSRRYKTLYPTVQAFIAFVGRWAEALHPEFNSHVLIEDASLFKACGPVWHQTDRLAGRVPEKLRNLDQEASWRKSAYHGWVYGYSLHLTTNRSGFPKLAQVETASLAESGVLDQKKEALFALEPRAVVGDNAYCKAMRVRTWTATGVLLLTPAATWQKGRYALAYHRLLAKTPFADWLNCRKTAIEPVFDLFSKLLGTTNNHKQLPLPSLAKVQPFLCLGVLAGQIAMIVNHVFALPLRQISTFLAAFS
jgi:DDE family transposase